MSVLAQYEIGFAFFADSDEAGLPGICRKSLREINQPEA
jgi:hypothetical protein